MKKKNIVIIVLTFLILIGAITTYIIYNNKNSNNDSSKFKKEYENLNNKQDSNNNTYMNLSLPSTKSIKYVSGEEVVDIIKNKTGVIYFGFPECPWCRNAITPLLDVINDNEVETLYYYNNKEDRDIKSLDGTNIVTEKEGTDNYYQIVDLLKDYLGEYKGLNDPSIKRLYYPTVVFVHDGKVDGIHVSTVESHTVGKTPLNEAQTRELKNIYQGYIDKIYGGVCDQSC